MANKDAIVNKFNADEATVTETVRKGKYRVFNGTDYDVVHLQTSADQVLQTNEKKFVSQNDITKWNSKADASHKHDDVYAKKGDSYTKAQTDGFLKDKANVQHAHTASSITVDSTHQFVTNEEKARWTNTYTVSQTDLKISDAIKAFEITNSTQLANITKGYQDADTAIDNKVTAVKSDLTKEVTRLTELINNGGTANDQLAARVTTIETTTIPGVRKQVSDLETKITGVTNNLSTTKADKAQVEADIAEATSELQAKIDLKSEKTYVDNQLKLKANSTDVYTTTQMDNKLTLKANKEYVDTELATKVSTTLFNNELSKKANDLEIKNLLKTKADAQALKDGLALKAEKSHEHNVSDIPGLGSAATRHVGVQGGNVPVLNAQGKLEQSVLPAIAINDKFTADSTDKAMTLDMQIGDILILTSNAIQAVIEKQEKGEAITYQVAKSKKYQQLSDEYITYIASGTMTYLCVNDKATTFEEKFKPLQSVADTISKGEVESKLTSKVNTSDFNSYKSQVTNSLNSKADQSNTYTIADVNSKLDKKVDKENGKVLSSNDFTNELKAKLDSITNGANNYSHPTGDGNLHVPRTGTSNNGKFLMAGTTAGSLSWSRPTTGQIDETDTRKFLTPDQIAKWDAKAENVHTHNQYRLISNSLSTAETTAAINKLKTIISTKMPSSTEHIAGAVWIEETF